MSQQAQARRAFEAARREQPDTPPRGFYYGPDTRDYKWRARARAIDSQRFSRL